jgi:Zn finger protein HypA/HybF involved in hydrogenase expression
MARVLNRLHWQTQPFLEGTGLPQAVAGPDRGAPLAQFVKTDPQPQGQAEPLTELDDRESLLHIPRSVRDFHKAKLKLERWKANPHCGQCRRWLPEPKGFSLMSQDRIICIECRRKNDAKRTQRRKAERQRVHQAYRQLSVEVLALATACHDCGRSVQYKGDFHSRPHVVLRGGVDVAVCRNCFRRSDLR